MVCGQQVSTTLRGKPVFEMSEEALLAAQTKDDEKYKKAKDTRVKLERTAQLEQYQEKKLVERIRVLEEMQAAEADYQKELKQRENRRQTRNDELKEQLNKDWTRKLDAERREQEEKE